MASPSLGEVMKEAYHLRSPGLDSVTTLRATRLTDDIVATSDNK